MRPAQAGGSGLRSTGEDGGHSLGSSGGSRYPIRVKEEGQAGNALVNRKRSQVRVGQGADLSPLREKGISLCSGGVRIEGEEWRIPQPLRDRGKCVGMLRYRGGEQGVPGNH